MNVIKKKFHNFPFAHRQPNHEGHCRFIHGHNWSFEFVISATELDKNGFVVDFGNLEWIKTWLDMMFDHTLVLNEDDPQLFHLQSCLDPNLGKPLADIRSVPNCGAEGLAKFVFETIQQNLRTKYNERVILLLVTVFEDDKNSATYSN